jgi:hypothetical protein
MHEQRQFFRLTNEGEIEASLGIYSLKVINISATSISIFPHIELPKTGIIELKIQTILMKMDYILSKIRQETTILKFTQEEQIDKLFIILKRLRAERKNTHS